MIYTFYSYKGGVGRTMALANIAELFYQGGLKVLMVDFDLEAPGLDRFFADDEAAVTNIRNHRGIIDLLLDYKEAMAKPLTPEENEKVEQGIPLSFPLDGIDAYCVELAERQNGRLWLLPVGIRADNDDNSYAQSVLTFNWQDFYDNWEGERFFEWFRKQCLELADVVLIDSRTGVTEMGGISTYQLADVVVLFTIASEQSLAGTYRMVDNLRNLEVEELRGRPLDVLVLPTRVDDAERENVNKFNARFLERFNFLSKSIGIDLWELRIPYLSAYAFDEKVAVKINEPGDEKLVDAYDKCLQVLAGLEEEGSPASKLSSGSPLAKGFEYDVYISYAEEQEYIARAIAEALRAASIRVRFDRWKKNVVQNGTSPSKLDESRLILCLVSRNWLDERWGDIETNLMPAQSLLPVRTDETPLPDKLSSQPKVIDLRNLEPGQLRFEYQTSRLISLIDAAKEAPGKFYNFVETRAPSLNRPGRVFLSYAEEDSSIVMDIAERLEAEGLDVFAWQYPSERGKRFIQTVEKEIYAARVFVVFMSPNYLASQYCINERDLALRWAAEFESQSTYFVSVAKVGKVDSLRTGFLSSYNWYDMTGDRRDNEIKNLVQQIKLYSLGGTKATSKWPTFQDRREELDDLLSNLLNTAGDRFFLLLAGPKMGKTWLLDQLPLELAEKEIKWKILRINLSEQPLSVRGDSEKLLSAYFGDVVENSDKTQRARGIARLIAKSERPWLLLLDDAELLSNEVAMRFRKSLSDIHRIIIERLKNVDIRLAFVAASRAQLKSWRGVIPRPRFHTIALPPFNRGVIINVLKEMAEVDKQKTNGLGNSWYSKTTQALEKATEGLPQLLMAYMQWIREDQYFTTEKEILSQELFDKLAVPYVENYLLSKDSLFPFDTPAKNIREKEKILQAVLLKLSPYRRLSESHLERFLEIDDEINYLLVKLTWTVLDLWNALSKTYIIEQSFTVLHQIYPAIRRLLFRYQFRDDDAQKLAHKQASQFMGNWWREISGTDRSLYLIESLWHLSEYNRLAENGDAYQQLINWARQTFYEALKPTHTSFGDLAMFITNRMGEDEELQHSLEAIRTGLFNQILEIIDHIYKS